MSDPLSTLRNLIDKADSAYHRPGFTPIMTDAHYDARKAELRGLAPGDHRLTRVGVPYDPSELRTKVAHKLPMGSLDNTDGGIVGLRDWYTKVVAKLGAEFDIDLVASHKIDGNSVAANYELGILKSVISRGNGDVGEDVTANAVHFQDLPAVLPFPLTISVRGEAVLFREDFDVIVGGRLADDRTNPRNVGSGIMGRSDGRDAARLRFIAFNAAFFSEAEPSTTAEKYSFLRALGFAVVHHQVCTTVEEVEAFYERAQTERADLPYEIDGCVVELSHVNSRLQFVTADIKSRLRPKFARAIKFPEHSATTMVVGVTVTVGHTGAVIPTAQLARVWVGGAKQGVHVENALLTNYDEVQRLDVAVGDTVQVVLAGDIIPKIVRVLERLVTRIPITPPLTCPSCGCLTTRESRGEMGANLYCTNPACDGVMVGKIHHWIGNSKKGVGILDIGDAMEAALFQAGLVRDPADLYRLTPAAIADVLLNGKTRIGGSRAKRVVDNIAGKRELPLHVFLGSLGVDLLGRRRVQLLATGARGELDRLEDWLDDAKLESIQVHGLGEIQRRAIREGIDRCRPLIEKLLAVGVVVLPAVSRPVETEEPGAGAGEPAGSFTGLSFCFTGTREGIAEVEARGGQVQDDVRKGTTYLVQKGEKPTNKAQKAEKYGTKVITLDQLKLVFAGEAVLP